MLIEKIKEIVQARTFARRDLEDKISTMSLNDPERVVIVKTIEETDEKIKKLSSLLG